MSKLAQRLLIFFIGVPLVLGLIFIKFFHHLPLNAAIIAVSVISGVEMYNMCRNRTELLPKWLVVALCVLLPAAAYLFMIFGLNLDYMIWVFAGCATVLMAVECFMHRTFEASITRLSTSLFIVFYSGYLFTFVQRIGDFENSTFFLMLFFFTVFIHDSLAWLFGVLLGRTSRGIFAASPNKSVVGCVGGLVGALASCVLARFFWEQFMPGSYLKPVLLGLLCSVGAITGDLVESVFKRSADVKDSGRLVPGRGGLLDSVDSLLFTAPVYYIAVHFLFSQTAASAF